MRPQISLTLKVVQTVLISMTLLFSAASVTPQGRGRKVGLPPVIGVPRVPGGIGGARQGCIQACNTSHRTEAHICHGRTGRDRAACQRSINEQHRLCMQSCPR